MRFRGTAIACLASLVLAGPAGAVATQAESPQSENIKEIARGPIKAGEGGMADGSDLAFQGNLIVAGSYSGTAFFKILKGAPYIKQLGFHACPGGQGDVSVYQDLAFVSLNGAQSQGSCLDPGGKKSDGKAGVRILDISDPSKPVQINYVETDCGSHTHVINPHGDKVYIYNQSYPLGVQTQTCSVVSHRKVSIIEVDVDAPEKAKVIGTLDVSPEIGCHDVTIFPDGKHAAAACIGETQIWDVSDPAKPSILTRIYNPSIEIHHGTGVTWDGKVLAIADEFAGSVTGECVGDQQSPIGALWFYDITDIARPQLLGYYNVNRGARPDTPNEAAYMKCTSHNFSILPMKDPKKYVATVGYRSAGMSVVDFSDPANPVEAAFYQQMEDGNVPDVWSAYWYNGRIYTNDNAASRGVSVYEMKGTGSADVRYFRDRLNPQVQIPDFKG